MKSHQYYKYDFDFDHVEEVKIYRYAIDKVARKRKQFKKINEKYYSYNEWKDQHAIKKYEHITYDSLCNLRKYFIRKLENEIDKDNSMSGFIYPIFIVLINLMSGYISDVTNNPDYKVFTTTIVIFYFTYRIIKFQMFDDIAIKNLYRDYIEIIEEMIEWKKKANQITSY